MQKTYKRETAWALLALTFALAFSGNSEIAEIFVWPSFAFAGAAFGFDAYAKQIK